MIRVLHVIEAFGGGVAAAVRSFAAHTPEAAHFVLAFDRPGHEIGADFDEVATLMRMPRGKARQFAAVVASWKALRPDVVHAHSSIAGLYVRAMPGIRRKQIVYTPHCFAFERGDVSPAVRRLFWSVEAALSIRTGIYAAISPREAALACELPGRRPVAYVPNTTELRMRPERQSWGSTPPRIAAVGRICSQKGFEFFAEAARIHRAIGGEAQWVWIGGGSKADERWLRDEGIVVTGWMSRSCTLAELERADLYVHTAAWEGAPISLLEAAFLSLPLVCRRIDALASLGVRTLAADPAALARLVCQTLASRAAYAASSRDARELAIRHRPSIQAAALTSIYEGLAESRADVAPSAAGVSP